MLDSGVSILVLNYPTHLTIAKLLNITCNNTTNHTSKILTAANQTVVLFLHDVTTLVTSIEQTCRPFIIPFAVADIKYIILGTPFFEEYIQNIFIQDISLQFKHQSKDQPKTTKLTYLLSNDYP